ncbi:HET-domain-containing protein, partial [Macroventuria anomochaeta]
YKAVSYVWGNAVKTKEILLNGKAFTVRMNLHSFLQQLIKDRSIWSCLGGYWIDAICIDQTNVAERNYQVALMGKIYSRAFSVIVWLGRGNKRLARAM